MSRRIGGNKGETPLKPHVDFGLSYRIAKPVLKPLYQLAKRFWLHDISCKIFDRQVGGAKESI
jgi:hypothetical protein